MVLLGLRIKPVINRQICSNPSIRRKTFLKLSIPLARISGTRIIGSMASPFFFYLLTPLIFLHSLIFPNNLPSRVHEFPPQLLQHVLELVDGLEQTFLL